MVTVTPTVTGWGVDLRYNVDTWKKTHQLWSKHQLRPKRYQEILQWLSMSRRSLSKTSGSPTAGQSLTDLTWFATCRINIDAWKDTCFSWKLSRLSASGGSWHQHQILFQIFGSRLLCSANLSFACIHFVCPCLDNGVQVAIGGDPGLSLFQNLGFGYKWMIRGSLCSA